MVEGVRGGGRFGGGEGTRRTTKAEGGTGQQSACNPRVPKAQNKLLGASCLACSIFGAGTMIPAAKSCGSVGKLGDRADPEGATASNGDVPEARGTEETQGEEAGGQGEERTREGEEKEEGIQGSPSGREDRGRFPKRSGRRG